MSLSAEREAPECGLTRKEWFAADVAFTVLRIYRQSSGNIADADTMRPLALAVDPDLDPYVLSLALDVLEVFHVECTP